LKEYFIINVRGIMRNSSICFLKREKGIYKKREWNIHFFTKDIVSDGYEYIYVFLFISRLRVISLLINDQNPLLALLN